MIEEIVKNQMKRVKNGTIVKYKDGEEYFSSPGYTTVKLKELKKYVKSIGLCDI